MSKPSADDSSPAPTTTVEPPCDGTFELALRTDAFGLDTRWELADRNFNDAVLVSESGFPSNSTLQFTECLDQRRCYRFIIYDEWEGQWQQAWMYEVSFCISNN